MREIKFRAWNGERMKEVLTWGFNEKFISTPKECSPEEDFKIMQFTGLYDKNKKPIYEGDIVQELDHTIQDTKKDNKLYNVGDKIIGWDKKEYIIESIVPNSNKGYEYINLLQYWSDKYTEVKYDPKYGYLPFADSPDNCGCCGGGEKSSDSRVVGNIYQNPELLK